MYFISGYLEVAQQQPGGLARLVECFELYVRGLRVNSSDWLPLLHASVNVQDASLLPRYLQLIGALLFPLQTSLSLKKPRTLCLHSSLLPKTSSCQITKDSLSLSHLALNLKIIAPIDSSWFNGKARVFLTPDQNSC